MIRIENVEVTGWKAAVRGMRNPMNSWNKSDSAFKEVAETHELVDGGVEPLNVYFDALNIGPNDHDLMMRLTAGGPVHAKYRRMIAVYCDITAPLYWWKEFDTYKVGTVANSCSTMHKIADKEFSLEDFSCEDLGIDIPAEMNDGEPVHMNLWEERFKDVVEALNLARARFNQEENQELKKKYWRAMIQFLPSSYNQKRTVMLNYEVLAGIYPSRKNHKLDEWRQFCEWIKELPYSEVIVGAK